MMMERQYISMDDTTDNPSKGQLSDPLAVYANLYRIVDVTEFVKSIQN